MVSKAGVFVCCSVCLYLAFDQFEKVPVDASMVHHAMAYLLPGWPVYLLCGCGRCLLFAVLCVAIANCPVTGVIRLVHSCGNSLEFFGHSFIADCAWFVGQDCLGCLPVP